MYPYNYSYETLALRSYSIDKIVKELRIASTNHSAIVRAEGEGTQRVNVLVDKKSDVPAFGHPVIFDNRIFIDARGLVAVTSASGDYRIKDKGEYHFRTFRAAVELAWADDEDFADQLIGASDLPLELYTRFVSEGITQRLGLDPETQARLAAVSGFFYLATVEGQVNDKIWQRNVAMVSRVTRIPAARIVEWFPEPLFFESIASFTNYVSEHLDNPRLNKLDPALLYGILANGWFTQHGSEVMGAALEFPATWVACCYYAVGDRNLRNSRIGKLIQRTSKGDRDVMFQRSVLSLLR